MSCTLLLGTAAPLLSRTYPRTEAVSNCAWSEETANQRKKTRSVAVHRCVLVMGRRAEHTWASVCLCKAGLSSDRNIARRFYRRFGYEVNKEEKDEGILEPCFIPRRANVISPSPGGARYSWHCLACD